MACLSLLGLFLVLVVSVFPPCYVHGISCIETERIALLSIKAGIDHSNNQSLFSSWTGQDCCKWQGVSCDHESRHVIKLDLRQYLSETYLLLSKPASKLNVSLVQLHHLKYLDLSMNNFNNSPIPDFIGSLANLEHLDLSNTGFSGIIPHTFGNLSSLRYLDLNTYSNSIIQASDLHWLSRMTSLHHLDLSGVDLSNIAGWLHEFNLLPFLVVLKLSDAGLQADAGGIHDTTPLHHLNLTSLRVLDLSGNYDLNITLLHWLFNLTGLVNLDLSSCFFYDKFPDIFGNMSSLRVLSLSTNCFDGVLPRSLGNLGSLERLDLSQNDFNGSIPESLSNLTNLVYFNLYGNQVQGLMPANIGNLRNLQFLDLIGNKISGAIPESFGNLTLLQHFDGSGGNGLSGKLPETIGNLVHLQFLDLSHNALAAAFGKALSGKLPESIGNLTQLQQLRMPGNGIMGGLPESAGKLSSLWELDLSGNNINGTLPKGMGKPLFHNLPVECWDGETLETITSNFGNLIKVDEFTSTLARSKYARVCIEIDLSKPLCRGFWIGDDFQRVFVVVMYERLPTFCYNCGLIGHGSKSCTRVALSGAGGFSLPSREERE
ncbi:receptor-like protein EIX2 [Dioscorea cayenensis subsp. rotundata]|uniref:Receptor-like protein EIX2 n=1 Tax=Dioscorea cayennensis subsp. rotundata TaxID=55577 RepID=A0AB40CDN6_DIOCR|nr:receptor-like protein EIX2 [Dioscorea cayenensis subsp. rotundata]